MALPNLPPILKKNLPLVIAGISALLAVLLINLYIRQQAEQEKKRLQEMQSRMVNVVVAAKDIARGTRLTEGVLSERPVSREKVPQNVATSLARVLDKFTTVAISKGNPIFLDKLAVPEKRESWQPLSSRIPPGKRAVMINVEDVGMIRPGDFVDIMGLAAVPAAGAATQLGGQLSALPLFQNVLVLAVGQETNPRPTMAQQQLADKPKSVTLALSPQEANIVTFVAEQGKIRLVLRSPMDKQSPRNAPADWDTVLKTILPPEMQASGEVKPRRTIEVYHGAKKEIKALDY